MPTALCKCGCGEPVGTWPKNDAKRGRVKGAPKRFRPGHYGKAFPGRMDMAERFWSKVERSDEGCWLWQAGTLKFGYGMFSMPGHDGRPVLAHRIAYMLTYGEIPEGLNVLHRCDVPPCVRPDHLFLGTQGDNVRDMYAKGRGGERGLAGERHHAAILTEAGVRTIRAESPQTIADMERLGLRLGVSRHTIQNVVNGRTWRCVR